MSGIGGQWRGIRASDKNPSCGGTWPSDGWNFDHPRGELVRLGALLTSPPIMPIPPFDAYGMLPAGVHDCELREVQALFCWNTHRIALFQRLNDFITERLKPLGMDATLWIDGSFTRNKESPVDIDIVADVSHLPLRDVMPLIALQLDGDVYKRDYHVDFWVKHPALPEDPTAFFQYVGPKAAGELRIERKQLKGVLRILP